MQNSNTNTPSKKVVNPIDDTAASPSISWGGSPVNSSGTGIRGTDDTMTHSVSGTDVVSVSSSGVAVTGDLSMTRLFVPATGGAGNQSMWVDSSGILWCIVGGTAYSIQLNSGL